MPPQGVTEDMFTVAPCEVRLSLRTLDLTVANLAEAITHGLNQLGNELSTLTISVDELPLFRFDSDSAAFGAHFLCKPDDTQPTDRFLIAAGLVREAKRLAEFQKIAYDGVVMVDHLSELVKTGVEYRSYDESALFGNISDRRLLTKIIKHAYSFFCKAQVRALIFG